MLRAAVAVVVGGYAFGGLGTGAGQHAEAATVSHVPRASVPASAGTGASAGTKTVAGTKTIQFRGYQLDVPASWPVYRLDQDPEQCVRYDVHAVYLGTPGTDQDCPPGLVGRTETVSIGSPATGTRPPVISQRAVVAGDPARLGAPGVILQDVSMREFGVTMPASAPTVTATYGTDPALIKQVLASVRQSVPQKAPSPAASLAAAAKPVRAPGAPGAASPHPQQQAPPAPGKPAPGQAVPDKTVVSAKAVPPSAPAAGQPAGKPAAGQPAGQPAGSAPLTGKPAAPPAKPAPPAARPAAPAGAAAKPSQQPSPSRPATSGTPSPLATGSGEPSPSPSLPPAVTLSKGPQAGFDTCTAPSLQAMRAWKAKYSVAAVYIGGEEMACGYGNLSAQWVHATEAIGWSLMPTYVGPQAPCDSFSGKVDEKKAAAQGRQNAQWAVQDAAMFGMGKGSPIYYDMEAYDGAKQRCVTAVLTFLDAWTRQLNAEGYVSGVYSSADSGIIDLAMNTKVNGHPLAEPQAIWFALWDNASDLNCAPFVPPGAVWPNPRRSKQFAGPRYVKIHRIGLDIDSDLVNGAVAR